MATLKTTSGLVTFYNEINKREGSLEVADNVVIDANNTIEKRRGFTDFGASFASSTDRLKQLMDYKGRVLRHYGSTIEFDSTGNGDFLAFSGTYSELESGLRIKSAEVDGNFYFTTDNGIKKISVSDINDLSTSANFITNAGAVKAIDFEAKLKFTPGGFLPPESKCAYRVVWGYKDANNRLVIGAPSPRVILTNTSSDLKTPEQFDLTFTSNAVTDYDGTVADRYVLFNSSTTEYFLWFKSSAFPNAPQTSDTVGRTAIEANIEGLTTSDQIAVAAASALSSLSDFTVDLNSSIIGMISTENGIDLVDASSSANLTAVTTTIIEQGQIAEGSAANATITITVPSEITNNYFYQLYRTAAVSVTDETELIDINPGDDMNLAYEANITDAEISAGQVVFEDITTEDFRSINTILYTNPNNGEGILQANDRPPIAKDIALFRNTMFYANTKTMHRKQFNLLSTSGFTSGVSKLLIGNSDGVSSYTFIGEQEVTQITADSYANTTDTGYIELYSARDEREYYIWFDKGATVDPAVANKIGIRVFIESGYTANDVAQQLNDALLFVSDFSVSLLANVVTVTCIKNGNTTDTTIGAALGGAWSVTTLTQGDGENAAANEILLSNAPSIGQSIEEMSQSIIRVINKDVNCPVNAFYLSGSNDVPGIILFENRSLEDKAFYIGTTDSAISGKFNPELPVEQTLTAISTDNPTQITLTSHGLFTGDTIVLYNTDSTPTIDGAYTITVLDPNTFTVPTTVTSAGTTGNLFLGSVNSTNDETKNRLYYSKESQSEAVPILNYIDIGPRDKAIKRILPLRDNLFVLKEDGAYIITGTSSPNFGSRLIDSAAQITAPDSAALLNNQIYCLATQGIITVNESGARVISRPIENKILDITNFRHNFKTASFGLGYETDRAYFLWLPSTTSDTVGTQCYRYNVFTNTWTRWTKQATCAVINTDKDKLHIGLGDRNYSQEELKNRDRTDYSDRDFSLDIISSGVVGDTLQITSVSDITIGDSVVQSQYVTISQINRLLLRLDRDNGLDDTDYFSSLQTSSGDSLKTVLDNLNTKLVADDSSGTITSRVFSVDFATQQTEFNLMIDELNNTLTDTLFKDYDKSLTITPYESLVNDINTTENKIIMVNSLPFIEGPITIYKAIDSKIIWAPQHFGSPDTLKQVREGTIIFDQNNFYSAVLSYSSDRSANFEEIPFLSLGAGYFGGFNWGEAVWGGEGNEIPQRVYIPRDKQRCRHLKVGFEHLNARENVRILGISLEPRMISTRAYR